MIIRLNKDADNAPIFVNTDNARSFEAAGGGSVITFMDGSTVAVRQGPAAIMNKLPESKGELTADELMIGLQAPRAPLAVVARSITDPNLRMVFVSEHADTPEGRARMVAARNGLNTPAPGREAVAYVRNADGRYDVLP